MTLKKDFGDLSDLPDFERYKLKLDELKKIDFSNLSSSEIYHKIYDYLITFPCVLGGFKERTFNEFKFFRVRLNIDKSIENIGIVQTHSFPPTYYCKENGRANVSKTTVFYCSNDPLTAILEVKPNIGDEGYLSLWKPNVKRDVISAICLPTNLPNTNPWNKIANNSYNYLLNSVAQSEQKDKVSHLTYMYDFVSDLYKLEMPPYHITSMISWELIYGQFIRDFIVYPSIRNNFNTCNMAFHPNFVYNNLLLDKIIGFKIIDVFNGEIKFILSEKVGFFVHNKLKWKYKTKEDLIDFDFRDLKTLES